MSKWTSFFFRSATSDSLNPVSNINETMAVFLAPETDLGFTDENIFEISSDVRGSTTSSDHLGCCVGVYDVTGRKRCAWKYWCVELHVGVPDGVGRFVGLGVRDARPPVCSIAKTKTQTDLA